MPATRLAFAQLEDRLAPSVTVQFDYRYDTQNFFASPERKAALERAAADLTSQFRDDLAAIVPSGGNTWIANVSRPDSGELLELPNLTIPQGTVLVFVGGTGFGGETVGGNNSVTPAFRAQGSDAWKNRVASRGQPGVLAGTPTDTAPWGGSIGFSTSESWYFGTDASPRVIGDRIDFESVAVHELTHLFGFGDPNPAFRRWVRSDFTFAGPASVAAYGSPVPAERIGLRNAETGALIRPAPSHWAEGVQSDGRRAVMTPTITRGERDLLTSLDFGALQDIGWEVGAPSPPAVGPPTPVVAPPTPTVPPAPVAVTPAVPPVPVAVSPPPVALPVSTAVTAFPLPREFAIGGDAGSGRVRLDNPDGSARFSATPFGADFAGGVRTATADFNGDGIADLVAGTGPGVATRVVILDGVTRAELFSVSPFESAFTGGVFVAAGDLTGDGRPDLVITPDQGGGPRVRVFSGAGFGLVADFFGIDDPAFRGGARAAVGDVSGDGVGDLLVAAGFGGGPRVAIFDGRSLTNTPARLAGDFFAFEPALRDGVYLAAGDLDGDGKAEVIVGGGPGGGPRVTAFGGADILGNRQVPVANFFSGDPATRGGVRLAVKDLDGDGVADLLTGAGPGSAAVRAYRGRDVARGGTPAELLAFDADTGESGGVFVG